MNLYDETATTYPPRSMELYGDNQITQPQAPVSKLSGKRGRSTSDLTRKASRSGDMYFHNTKNINRKRTFTKMFCNCYFCFFEECDEFRSA